jgi:putative ABC transport system permease protein
VESEFLPYFQPLKDIYLKSANFLHDTAIRGNESYVKALSIISIFVLVIACFNFINLATARSFKRSKEIGIRKAIGAYRKQVVVQFIGETVILAVISMIIAMIVTVIMIPSLNNFTGKSIEFNPFTNPLVLVVLIISGAVIGVIAGIYPALVLSQFKPVKVLKSLNPTDKGLSTAWLRKSLVVIQFAISVILIISTIIVYRQTMLFNTKDLGFSKEQVLQFQTRGSINEKIETFKNELRRTPYIESVTSGYGLPGDRHAGDIVIIPGEKGLVEFPSNVFIGDHDYVKTLGLRLVAGRDFSRENSTDVKEAFIINETAVKHFGFNSPEDALGKPIYWKEWAPTDTLEPMKKGKIIGIVQDFNYQSLHEKVAASVIQLYPQEQYKIAVKISPNKTREAIAYIQTLWDEYVPEYPIDYQFMDESFEMMYRNEVKLSKLLWYFSIMAILIGCMGLFALAALSAEERTKEIGIRKAMGAKSLQILTLLSKNFLILVLIASAIAIPVAWIAMNFWLEDFAYRIDIEWWVFAVALIATIAIAMITTSFQTLKVSKMKPVKALRTE